MTADHSSSHSPLSTPHSPLSIPHSPLSIPHSPLSIPHSPLPKGYKRTEVGVIPENWEVKPFREIASFYSGGTPPTRIRSYYGGEIPWITSSDINKGFIDSVEGRITEAGLRSSSAKMVSAGTLLLALYGATAGKAAISQIEAAINQAVLALTPIQDNTMFLFYMLSHLKNWIIETYTQGGQPNLSAEIIKSILIPLPPLPEQRAIAAALADVDGLLAALDALIAKKRAVKTAAMQQLLTGKTRLPGFSGEWVTRRLGDVGECIRGVSYKPDADLSQYDSPTTIRLLRANNVQDERLDLSDLQFVNSERVSRQQILMQEDIVICMANGSKALVGKAAPFILDDGYQYTFGAFMGCFRTRDKSLAHPEFIAFLFQTTRYRKAIETILSGSSINNLKPSDIEQIDFQFPPPPEQRAIAAVLADMDAEIAALEARREKVRQIKQGMMQVLLTGKVRLV